MKPRPAKPRSSMAHVEGSGTAAVTTRLSNAGFGVRADPAEKSTLNTELNPDKLNVVQALVRVRVSVTVPPPTRSPTATIDCAPDAFSRNAASKLASEKAAPPTAFSSMTLLLPPAQEEHHPKIAVPLVLRPLAAPNIPSVAPPCRLVRVNPPSV